MDGLGRVAAMLKTMRHVKDGIWTSLVGLRITGKYFKPGTEVTREYPEVPQLVFERTRGRLDIAKEKCIACLLCARACPVECITIETESKLEGRGKRPALFKIDFTRCMFCGLCVEACKSEAIFHTGICDFSSYTREDLIVDFGLGFYTDEEKQAAEERKQAAAEASQAETGEQGGSNGT